MKKILMFLIIISLLLSLSACGESHSISMEAESGILCTNFPAYDFARAIAGERMELELLVPPGGESHSFEPTAQDIIKMKSWFLVCNGGESDAWLNELMAGGELEIAPLYMMDCVSVLEEEAKEGMQAAHHEHEHEHDEDCDHGHGEEMEYDEHVWTSPVNAALICRAICDRLCEISPENVAYFRENAENYINELEKLDVEFEALVENAKFHTLIFADRFPVRYFVEEYGLDYYAAFPGCAAEAEPSAKTVAFLIDRVREESIPAVFYIEFSNEKMADIICEDTGCKKLLFHSAHNVSAADFEAGITYLDIMRANLQSLREAIN